jgi:hypothetical protein
MDVGQNKVLHSFTLQKTLYRKFERVSFLGIHKSDLVCSVCSVADPFPIFLGQVDPRTKPWPFAGKSNVSVG